MSFYTSKIFFKSLNILRVLNSLCNFSIFNSQCILLILIPMRIKTVELIIHYENVYSPYTFWNIIFSINYKIFYPPCIFRLLNKAFLALILILFYANTPQCPFVDLQETPFQTNQSHLGQTVSVRSKNTSIAN